MKNIAGIHRRHCLRRHTALRICEYILYSLSSFQSWFFPSAISLNYPVIQIELVNLHLVWQMLTVGQRAPLTHQWRFYPQFFSSLFFFHLGVKPIKSEIALTHFIHSLLIFIWKKEEEGISQKGMWILHDCRCRTSFDWPHGQAIYFIFSRSFFSLQISNWSHWKSWSKRRKQYWKMIKSVDTNYTIFVLN